MSAPSTTTSLARAGFALTFGYMVMRGARPDADAYDRAGSVVLLAALVLDTRQHRRHLAHHHRVLELLSGVMDDLAQPMAAAAAAQHQAGVYVHPGPWLLCLRCRPVPGSV